MKIDYTGMFNILNGSDGPLSVIRIGDGESMVLSGNHNYVFQRQFGYIPNHREIVSNLIDAYNNADIIGVPTTKHHRISNHWKHAEHILHKKATRSAEAFKTSIDFHTDMLQAGLFKKLLDRDMIFCVSGRDVDKQIKSTFGCEVVSRHVTPEIKFEENKNQPRHYPEIYHETKEWIKKQDCAGKLCLVGAGILGKVYVDMFKRNGGVGVDIGNVFDQWYGKVTRGPNKGENVYTEEHKL